MNINYQNFLFQHPLLLNPRYATACYYFVKIYPTLIVLYEHLVSEIM